MNCPNCNKKLGIFKIGTLYKLGDKRFCSIKCKQKYQDKHIKIGNIQGRKVMKVLIWSFAILELFFIILALSSSGFGSFLGFVLVTVFSLVIAFIIALCYGAARRGKQIGDIIETEHKKLKHS